MFYRTLWPSPDDWFEPRHRTRPRREALEAVKAFAVWIALVGALVFAAYEFGATPSIQADQVTITHTP